MSAVDGTVKKVDTGAKTITVDTARGTEQTFHYFERTSVHGAEATGKTFHGLKEGDKVAVHYTTQGGEETFRLSEHAAKDTGKDIADGVGKSAKVTVYYTGEAGQKTAHFIKRVL